MIFFNMRKWIGISLMLLTWETQQAASLQMGQFQVGRVTDSAWRADVKTATLTRSGVELEAPVLTMGAGERMLLQFDILADEAENLRYTIAHCDADWHRDDLEPHEFINGFESGEIENIDFSFTTLRPFIHYHQTIPAKYTDFTHSGNYVVYVTNDEGDTLLSRRFWVSEQGVGVEAEVTKPYDGMEIMKRQEVDVKIENSKLKIENFSAPQLRPEYERVLVQQNGREDNARWLEFSGYGLTPGPSPRGEGRQLCYRFRQQNIFHGGNTFRYFDCSNLRAPMYNIVKIEEYGGEVFAMVRPEEDRSKKHFLNEKTLNGGMKVNVWDRQNKALQADYVWVNISLPMAQPMIDKSVYVVGQLTDWKLDSASRMDYVPEYKAYVKRLLLKQGYYSYLLLTAHPSGLTATSPNLGEEQNRKVTATSPNLGEEQKKVTASSLQLDSATERLEGDHWETPNQYTIFVYHREPSDRADRLVAVRRIQ